MAKATRLMHGGKPHFRGRETQVDSIWVQTDIVPQSSLRRGSGTPRPCDCWELLKSSPLTCKNANWVRKGLGV